MSGRRLRTVRYSDFLRASSIALSVRICLKKIRDLPEVNSISGDGAADYPDWETIEKIEVVFMNWVKSIGPSLKASRFHQDRYRAASLGPTLPFIDTQTY